MSRTHVVAALAALILLVAPAAGQTNYNAGNVPYYDPVGPEWDYRDINNWPSLCHNGKRQSPVSFIDLDNTSVSIGTGLQDVVLTNCDFPPHLTNIRIINDVTSLIVQINPTTADLEDCTASDPLGGDAFTFQQLHFHANSEHLFPHAHPDSEMHMVFQRETDKGEELLILAVLLVATNTTDIISKNITLALLSLDTILRSGRLPPPLSTSTSTSVQETDLSSLLPRRRNYLTYLGSLTKPPCTEDVRFVVYSVPQFMSKEALHTLRAALEESMPDAFQQFGNSRPPQPLNGRMVYRYVDVDGYHKMTEREARKLRDYVRGSWRANLGLRPNRQATQSPAADDSNSELELPRPAEVDVWDRTSANATTHGDKGGATSDPATRKPKRGGKNQKDKNSGDKPQHSRFATSKLAFAAALIIIFVGGIVYWRLNRDPVIYVGIDDEELNVNAGGALQHTNYGAVRT